MAASSIIGGINQWRANVWQKHIRGDALLRAVYITIAAPRAQLAA